MRKHAVKTSVERRPPAPSSWKRKQSSLFADVRTSLSPAAAARWAAAATEARRSGRCPCRDCRRWWRRAAEHLSDGDTAAAAVDRDALIRHQWTRRCAAATYHSGSRRSCHSTSQRLLMTPVSSGGQ